MGLAIIALAALLVQAKPKVDQTVLKELRTYVDPAVAYSPPVLPKGQNGWDLALVAAEHARQIRIRRKDGQLQSFEAFSAPLAELKRATLCSTWIEPVPPDSMGTSFDFLWYAELKGLVRALVVRAEKRLEAGHSEDAIDDLLTAHFVGERLCQGHFVLIG